MLAFQRRHDALATLAVQQRETSRYLLFNREMRLCGRKDVKAQKLEMALTVENPEALAFTGIHVISPRLLEKMSEEGVFSIIQTYLRLAGQGERIMGYRAEGYWRDLGRPENVQRAEAELTAD